MALTRLRANLDEYVQNKSWYWYLPFWLFAVYLFIRLLDFELGQPAPSFFISIAQSFNFFLHEISHLLAAFLPSIITAAAGSLSELLLGTALIVTAIWVRSYFASVFCCLWFMLATQATADYMADARAQNIPLVSFGGGDPVHDWNYVFTKLGVLQHDSLIAGIVRGFGIAVAVAGLVFSTWLLIRIIHAKAEAAHKAEIQAAMNKIAAKAPAERGEEPFIDNSLYPTAVRGRLANRDTPADKVDPDRQ